MSKLYRKISMILASDDDLKRRKFSVEDLEEYNEDAYTQVAGDGPAEIAAAATKVCNLPMTPVKVLVVQVKGDVLVKLNGDATGLKCASVGVYGDEDFNYGFLVLSDTEITSLSITNQGADAAEVEIGYAG